MKQFDLAIEKSTKKIIKEKLYNSLQVITAWCRGSGTSLPRIGMDFGGKCVYSTSLALRAVYSLERTITG